MIKIIEITYNIIIGMILGISVIKIGDNIFQTKTKINWKVVISVILYAIFIYLNYLIVDNLVKMLFIYMCLLMIYVGVYRKNVGSSSIGALICYLIIFASEVITILGLTLIFELFSLGEISTMKNTMITNIIIATIAIYISYKYRYKLNEIIKKVSNSTTAVVIGVTILMMMTISTFLANIKVNDYKLSYTVATSVIVIVGLLITGIVIIRQNSSRNVLLKKYNDLMEYSTSTEKMMEKYRINNHEHKNNLILIKSMIGNTNKEVEEFLDIIMKTKEKDKNYRRISELNRLPFKGLKGFLNHKIMEIEDDGIEVQINISRELENIEEEKVEENIKIALYQVMGILIDNAKEAAIEAKNKQVIISSYLNENKIAFEISNTYEGEIDLRKIQLNGYSSKGKNRGHGLTIMKNILKDTPKIENETYLEKKYFIQKIQFEVSKKQKKQKANEKAV